ncbi:hypothetical protein PC116_g19400 [Phytophthora cactorum]|uniref:Uncharacterized protein n=1 Tax=Phytophthora cactorum TaxID=29920 RepID=A0A8T1K6V8_9STRA|nr:hypothetical protein PC115_g16825 [Phytophthora cactorum]KAG3049920.1 hypothetical protein PC121_g18675 [Phytophthora cactorum]KAG4232367.1 hypothetical protein PC116_g19400 [Phytophthora cactorum]
MCPSGVAMCLMHHTERTDTQGDAAHHVRYGRQNKPTCEEEDIAALTEDRIHHIVMRIQKMNNSVTGRAGIAN